MMRGEALVSRNCWRECWREPAVGRQPLWVKVRWSLFLGWNIRSFSGGWVGDRGGRDGGVVVL